MKKTNMEITRLILEAMGKDESSIKFVEDRLGHMTGVMQYLMTK